LRFKYLAVTALLLIAIFWCAWFVFHDPYPARFSGAKDKAVCIRYEDGKYNWYRNGQPFTIKGASGYTDLAQLHAAGGNTIRTWDTTGLDTILANAEQNDVVTIVGLPMPYNNDDMDAFYNDDAQVQALYDSYERLIRKYKGSKAVLCWCLGNELTYPVKPKYFRFYKVFNRIIDMIHREDPDHPVTTTLVNFEERYIVNLKLFTHIDFISFNIFGAIRQLNGDLARFQRWWKGPYLITEWGIDGPWTNHDQTAWNAYVEPSSEKKAEQYLDVYQKYMPVKDPRFLGALVFYWGHKQETTPTWFSLLDKQGNKSAAVNTMQYIWTGSWPQDAAPPLKHMLLNDKGAKDNILCDPGDTLYARAYFEKTNDTGKLRFEWFVQPEDWYFVPHYGVPKEMYSIDSSTVSAHGDQFVFHAPYEEGAYRVFVKVYNSKGYFATCNTPFYVVGAK